MCKKIKEYKIVETLKAQAFFIILKVTLCMLTCDTEDIFETDVVDDSSYYRGKPNFFIRYRNKIYYPKLIFSKK